MKICKVYTNLNVAGPLLDPLPRSKHEIDMSEVSIRYLYCYYINWKVCDLFVKLYIL